MNITTKVILTYFQSYVKQTSLHKISRRKPTNLTSVLLPRLTHLRKLINQRPLAGD